MSVQASQRRISGRFASSGGEGSITAACAEIAGEGEDAALGAAYSSGIGGSYPGSIYGRVSGRTAEVGSTHRIAQLLEDGAVPHQIEGNTGLAFPWAGAWNGINYRPHFVLKLPGPDIVNHPGFQGSEAIGTGYDAMCDVAMDILDSYGLDLVM